MRIFGFKKTLRLFFKLHNKFIPPWYSQTVRRDVPKCRMQMRLSERRAHSDRHRILTYVLISFLFRNKIINIQILFLCYPVTRLVLKLVSLLGTGLRGVVKKWQGPMGIINKFGKPWLIKLFCALRK